VDTVAAAGVSVFVVHARKAWLQGLSPKENRTVPPLDHDLVARLKAGRPGLTVVANGGIASMDAVEEKLAAGLDGVMVGRAAYHDPGAMLARADRLLFDGSAPEVDPADAVLSMLDYIEGELARGERLARITRHMLGLFNGRPGARRWRQTLSAEAHLPGAGPEVVRRALDHVSGAEAAA
jgi:tRNA-dihydrouridine synthase A